MKRFLVVLLSVGLFAVLSLPAFALEGKFTGRYYARGSFLSNPSMLDPGWNGGIAASQNRGSASYYDGLMRLYTDLQIAKGVGLTMRFDALETIWGSPVRDFQDTRNDNISFERAYVDMRLAIGRFRVGHFGFNTYGTGFLDASSTRPGIRYSNKIGKADVALWLQKRDEGDLAANNRPNLQVSDSDRDVYGASVGAKTKTWEAGIQWEFHRDARSRAAAAPAGQFTRTIHVFDPYFIAKIGNIDLEGEAVWETGKFQEFDDGRADVDAEAWGGYLQAKYNIGPAYVGANFQYFTGDDRNTADKREGGMNSTLGYADDQPIFGARQSILFSGDYHDWVNTQGNSPDNVQKNFDNAAVYSLFAGITPTQKTFVHARLNFAQANEVRPGQDKDYGTEFDIMGSYKILDNLTYNVGFAYLWTGDYFKGTTPAAQTEDIYYLLHWIDLNF